MLSLVRGVRIRTRLLGAFGVVCLLPAGVAAVGIVGAGEQRRITQRMGQLEVLTREVMQLRFRNADISGWLGSIVVALALAAGLALLITASVVRPAGTVVAALRTLARRDLSVNLRPGAA